MIPAGGDAGGSRRGCSCDRQGETSENKKRLAETFVVTDMEAK